MHQAFMELKYQKRRGKGSKKAKGKGHKGISAEEHKGKREG
jgi:hypothetical protein